MNEGRILEPYSGLLQKSVPVCLFKIAGNLSLWTIVKTWTIKFVHNPKWHRGRKSEAEPCSI